MRDMTMLLGSSVVTHSHPFTWEKSRLVVLWEKSQLVSLVQCHLGEVEVQCLVLPCVARPSGMDLTYGGFGYGLGSLPGLPAADWWKEKLQGSDFFTPAREPVPEIKVRKCMESDQSVSWMKFEAWNPS